MEKGLLSRLQSYFSASFGGRYVEYLIKEILHDKLRAVRQLKKLIDKAIKDTINRGSPMSQIAKLKKFRNALH